MRKLEIVDITSTAFLPIKSGTIQFLQDSYNNQIRDLIASIRGSYSASIPYLLYGCVFNFSGASGPFDWTDGAIYFNGELFEAPNIGGFLNAPDTAVAAIVETPYGVNADPVTFSDTSVHNVHNIRTMSFVGNTAGSGLFDYTAMIPLNPFTEMVIDSLSSLPNPFTFNMFQNSLYRLPSNQTGTKNFITGDANDVPGVKAKFEIGIGIGGANISFSFNILTSFILNKKTGLQNPVLALPNRSSAYLIELEYLGTFGGSRHYAYSWF